MILNKQQPLQLYYGGPSKNLMIWTVQFVEPTLICVFFVDQATCDSVWIRSTTPDGLEPHV